MHGLHVKMSRAVVTGGTDFIGSHLVDRLLSEGFEVWVLDDFSAERMENISHHKDMRVSFGEGQC
jgi:nucleoside-diphosphate-sugar epimerase